MNGAAHDVRRRAGHGASPWRLATVAAVALLAWVVAQWGWRAFGPAPTAVPAGAHARAVEPPRSFGARIFGETPARRRSTGGAGRDARRDTRLLGVFAEANGAGFALFRLADRGPVLVAAGQRNREGRQLEAVHPGGVRIRDHGEVREIVLRPASGCRTGDTIRQIPPGVAPGARRDQRRMRGAGGIHGRRLSAERRAAFAALPRSPTAGSRSSPPGPGGLTVRDDSGFATMLGLKPGDRVTRGQRHRARTVPTTRWSRSCVR